MRAIWSGVARRVTIPYVIVSVYGLLLSCSKGSKCGLDDPTHKEVVISTAGGRITLDTASLVIPPDGVKNPVAISISARNAPDLPDVIDAHFVSPVFRFGPDRFRFEKPALLTIALPGYQAPPGREVMIVGWDESTKELARIESKVEPGGVSAAISHFSEYRATEFEACSKACLKDSGGYQLCCNKVCTSMGSALHCNNCTPCPAPEVCCRNFPDPGMIDSYACVDLQRDNDRHCGVCGENCYQKLGGNSRCCSLTCRQLDTDPDNCGACDHHCQTDELCKAGKCEKKPPGYTIKVRIKGTGVGICDAAIADIEDSFEATVSGGSVDAPKNTRTQIFKKRLPPDSGLTQLAAGDEFDSIDATSGAITGSALGDITVSFIGNYTTSSCSWLDGPFRRSAVSRIFPLVQGILITFKQDAFMDGVQTLPPQLFLFGTLNATIKKN